MGCSAKVAPVIHQPGAQDFRPSQGLILESVRERQSILHVWRGCPGAGGVLVCCDDNTCGLQSCCPNVPVSPGDTYYFIVDGSGGESGNYMINIVISSKDPMNPELLDKWADAVINNIKAFEGEAATP